MAWIGHQAVTHESMSGVEDISLAATYINATEDPIVLSGNHSTFTTVSGGKLCIAAAPAYTSLRVGWWQHLLGGWESFDIIRFTTTVNSGTLRGGVQFANGELRLYSYSGGANILVDCISWMESGIQSLHEWIHLGLTIGPTYTSFYINSVPVLNSGKILHEPYFAIMDDNNDVGEFYFDDFYIEYSSSAEVNAPPPPYRFIPMRMVAMGDSEQWKTTDTRGRNALTVAKKGSTTTPTVFADSTGLVDLYRVYPINAPQYHDPVAVGGHVFANRDARDVNMLIKYGGVTETVALSTLGLTGYIAPGAYRLLDPSGAAWDWAKVLDTQIGIASL